MKTNSFNRGILFASLFSGLIFLFAGCNKEKDEVLPTSDTPGKVYDIDGNKYKTVIIGEQIWMAENLKTTKYRNGTPIIYGADHETWSDNTTGAYGWSEYDIGWKDSYGALYNWHAVNNANHLCPPRWHVPSRAEWQQLIDYLVSLGYTLEPDELHSVGNALRSCWQIDSPLGDACNTEQHPRWSYSPNYGFDAVGFSALPGGSRDPAGFEPVGFYASWWTSTVWYPGAQAWAYTLPYVSNNLQGIRTYLCFSKSVRCVRD